MMMDPKIASLGVLCASLLCLSSSAYAVVLGFEGFDAGQIIDDEYAANPISGVTISALNPGVDPKPNAAVIFNTVKPTGGDTDLGAPFTSTNSLYPGEYDPGNVLIIHATDNCSASACSNPNDEGTPGGKFEFLFNTLVTLNSLDFFDINTNEGEPVIQLFGANNSDLGTINGPKTGGDNTWNRLIFSDATDVERMVITMGGSGAIDRLDYTVIPVPPAVWLFASGLLGMIGIARRKKRSSPRR